MKQVMKWNEIDCLFSLEREIIENIKLREEYLKVREVILKVKKGYVSPLKI